MRESGPIRLLVYCADYKCAHSVVIDADRWPDHVRLSDLEPKFTCQACGHRGADVRPLFEPARMGTNGQDALGTAKPCDRSSRAPPDRPVMSIAGFSRSVRQVSQKRALRA